MTDHPIPQLPQTSTEKRFHGYATLEFLEEARLALAAGDDGRQLTRQERFAVRAFGGSLHRPAADGGAGLPDGELSVKLLLVRKFRVALTTFFDQRSTIGNSCLFLMWAEDVLDGNLMCLDAAAVAQNPLVATELKSLDPSWDITANASETVHLVEKLRQDELADVRATLKEYRRIMRERQTRTEVVADHAARTDLLYHLCATINKLVGDLTPPSDKGGKQWANRVRVLLMCAFLIFHPMVASDLCELMVDEVAVEGCEITFKYLPGRKPSLDGKMMSPVAPLLSYYLRSARPHLEGGGQNFLFLNTRGGQLSMAVIEKDLNAVFGSAVGRKISINVLRRMLILAWIQAGMNHYQVATMFGLSVTYMREYYGLKRRSECNRHYLRELHGDT